MNHEGNFKNILVFRIGHLGDTIVALPAFWAIRKKFPGARISLLSNSDPVNKNYILARSVLPETELFDSFLAYENPTENWKRIASYAKLLLRLRSRRFDCVFYLAPRNREIRQIERDLKFFRAAGIKRIFGAEYLKENRLEITMSENLPEVAPEYKFLIESLPAEIFDDVQEHDHDLALTDAETRFADDWLRKNVGDDFREKMLLALAPGSKWESKTWFEDRFVSVVSKLVEKKKMFPIVFGGSEDFEKGERILSAIGLGANAAGALNVRQAAAALASCDLYLGNDTGTMHMAAVVGTPCVVTFAANDYPGRWNPFGQNNKVLRRAVECQGCQTAVCFNKNKCLDLIPEDEVFKACLDVLAVKKDF